MTDLEALQILAAASRSHNYTFELIADLGLEPAPELAADYANCARIVKEARDYAAQRLKEVDEQTPGFGRFG